jgi:Protein of unknown function (DUF1360)
LANRRATQDARVGTDERHRLGEPKPPYAAYSAIMATFAGGLVAATALARLLDRDPRDHTGLDLAVLSLATFKAARTLSRDDVTSFMRSPFVESDARSGHEEPVPTGDLRQAVGELVTCSRCIGTWAAAGLAASQVLAPRSGRLLTWTLAAGGLNDFLLAGFSALTHRANLLEQQEQSA